MSEVFDYIAYNRPAEVQDLCMSFGYPCDTHADATQSLITMTQDGGEPTLKEIMNLHPEKDLIIELFSEGGKAKRTTCPNCPIDNMMVKTNQADGGQSTMSAPKEMPIKGIDFHLPAMLQQTNTLLIMGIISAFVIAMVVYKK